MERKRCVLAFWLFQRQYIHWPWSASSIIRVFTALVSPHQLLFSQRQARDWWCGKTLLICLFTACWAVSHYSGHAGGSAAPPGSGTVLCRSLPAWQGEQSSAHWKGATASFRPKRVGVFWTDGLTKAGVSPARRTNAPIFKCSLDFRGATPPAAPKQMWRGCVT